nr:hypothetical protein [Tanacetum cinerariifolium]
MTTTIDQQVALDEALVPSTKRLRIRRNVPEIYMHEFWATAIVHHHSIRFKMNNKKHIINLETFREMSHVCPRVPGQSFDELPFKEEILEFLRSLGHSDEIRNLTDVNVNKLFQPWRSFEAVINKCLTRKSSGFDSFRLSQAQLLDDNIFLTIKVVSRHQDTQQYGVILPIELTNKDIRNTTAYKEYYACATGVPAPKPKASAKKKRGDSDTSLTPPIATPTPITTAAPVPSDDGSDDGNDDDNDETVKDGSERDDDDDDNDDEEALVKIDEPEDTDSGRGGDEVTKSEGESDKEETRQEEEESFDPIPRTPEGSDDEGNDEEDQDLRLSEEARIQEEEEADELYRNVDINQGRGLQVSQHIEDSHVTLTPVHPDGLQESSSVSSFVTSMLNPISDAGVESIFMTASSPIVSLQTPTPIMTPSNIATITKSSDAPIPPTTIPSTILENLPTFDSVFHFDERLKSLENTFSEYRQTNPFVKSQVKEQVSRILPRIEESVNATLEAEFLTRSSHSSRTSYAVAADLSEMELKKILIEKIKGNKSIQRSDEQQNLYKALVEAYDADKTILDTYGESTILKRRREDNDQERPSAGSDWGSKRRRERGEHASASTPSEIATRSAGRSTTGSQSRQLSASESAFAKEPPRRPPTPDRDWNKTLPAAQGNAQSWISELARKTDARSSFNELLDTLIDFSNFIMNRLDVDTLTPELLAGHTYELMRGSCNSLTELEYHLEEVYKETTDQLDWVNPEGQQYPHNLQQPLPLIPNNRGRRVIPFEHFINNDLEYLRGGASSKKYTTSITKTKAVDYGHIKWIEDLVPRTMWI